VQYLLLIYGEEKNWDRMTPAERESMYAEFGAFNKEITEKGKNRGGHQLMPVASATTVRMRGGKRVVTDGPFAETKEQLGGFYLVDADDLDDAIAMAAKIPSARDGCIEVRPLVVRAVPAQV